MDIELHNSIIAAIRNPDNSDNLKLVSVMLEGLETTAVCFEDEKEISPMVLIVTPEIFDKLSIKI